MDKKMKQAIKMLKEEIVGQTGFAEYCRMTGTAMFAFANDAGEIELTHSPIGAHDRGFKTELARAVWKDRLGVCKWTIWTPDDDYEPADEIFTDFSGVVDTDSHPDERTPAWV